MIIKKKVDNRAVLKRVAILSFASIFFIGLSYFVFLPVIIKAANTGTAVPTLSVTAEVNITSPGTITLQNSIPGMTGNYGNPATGTATFTVTSNSVTGFTLTLSSGTDSNVLATGSYHFSDYAASGTPSYAWSSPAVGSSSFGFAIGASGTNGVDAAQAFKNNGGACNISGGTNSASFCWRGFQGTNVSPVQVINRTTASGVNGISESVVFKAEYRGGTGYYLTSGVYTATITATVAAQ